MVLVLVLVVREVAMAAAVYSDDPNCVSESLSLVRPPFSPYKSQPHIYLLAYLPAYLLVSCPVLSSTILPLEPESYVRQPTEEQAVG